MMKSISVVGRDMRQKYILLASFVLLLGAAFAASAATLEQIKKSGKLTLGYVDNTRPYSFRDDSGNPSGYAIELCMALVEEAKAELGRTLTVSFIAVAKEEAVRTVAQGKVDLMCTPAIPSVALRKSVSFSTPVFASGISVLVRSDSPKRLRDILSGRTPQTSPTWRANADKILQRSNLAVLSGGRAEKDLMAGLNKLKLSAKIIPANDYAMGVASVVTQRADAFFGDRAMLLDAAKQHQGAVKLVVLDRYFTHEVGAFALARSDEDFRLLVDQGLGKVINSDRFVEIYTKWFGPLNDTSLSLYRLSALGD